MKLTIKVKLLPTPEQKASLIKTMEVFNEACNYISKVAYGSNAFGQVRLHHLCYRYVRDHFGLSAQLTVRAIGKVSESYKSYKADKKRLHYFKKHSAVVYDNRILSFRKLDKVSILSLDGRFMIPIVFGSYAKLEQRRIRGQADMVYQNGNLFLCLCIELPDGTPIKTQGVLGVDLGIVNLATTSDGETFSGETVDKVRVKFHTIKKTLQHKGTKSAKRHLKKLSGRERRFKRHVNHTIAKRIVLKAKGTERAIALEDLKGFHFRKTVSKPQRERFGKWAFYELRNLMAYKAQLAGIPVVFVDPRNTSRTCSNSRCGYVSKSNRKSQAEFVCLQCGYSLNADVNGAKIIALRASVNTPVAVHIGSQTTAALGTASPLPLGEGS